MSNNSLNSQLRVKADSHDASPEERKKSVRKLAGAIAQSLRVNGEVSVRGFGNACIGKATKGLAISREFVSSHGLELYCAPAFIEAEMNGIMKTGISFNACTESSTGLYIPENVTELRVKSDGPDVGDAERKRSVRSLAGAIAHALRDEQNDHKVVVRCFGNSCVGKAGKALAIARGFVAVHGMDLYCTPYFIEAEINGETKTGLSFFVFTEGNS